MELKLYLLSTETLITDGLNRTFYGIETLKEQGQFIGREAS